MPRNDLPEAESPAPPRVLMRNRDYRAFIAVIIVASLSQTAQSVAVGWDIYERTGSALALGWVGLAQFLPIGLFFLPAGQIADRHERRGVMAASMALWAVACAILIANSMLGGSVFWMYLSLALTGFATLLNRASRDALLASIVPSEHFAEAMAWNSSCYQISTVAGPALAGALIAATKSATTVYMVQLVGILVTIALIFRIRPGVAPSVNRARSWRDLFGGVHHVWHEKVVLGFVCIDLFAMLLGTATALMPMFAKDVLHSGPQGLGLLSAAPAVGALSMALLQGFRRPYRRAGPAFLIAIAIFGFAITVFGLSRSFWLSVAALIVAGAADNIGVVIRQTLVQIYTPDALRGRVSALNRMLISASNELGALRAGACAAAFGPAATVVAGGVIILLVVAAGMRAFPMIVRIERYDRRANKP